MVRYAFNRYPLRLNRLILYVAQKFPTFESMKFHTNHYKNFPR
jgi:hypothetical protein